MHPHVAVHQHAHPAGVDRRSTDESAGTMELAPIPVAGLVHPRTASPDVHVQKSVTAPDHRRIRPDPIVRRMQGPEEGLGPEPKGSANDVVLLDVVVDKASLSARTVPKSSAELVGILRPLLQRYLQKVRYNSLEDAAAFSKHLDAARSDSEGVTPQQAFESFTPSSIGPLTTVLGAQCVGQALDFASMVAKQSSLPAYATAAQFAGRRQYGHAAALLKFQNPDAADDGGFILMDPGFNADEPLVITPTANAKLRKFSYRWNPDKSKLKNVNDTGQVAVTFDIDPLLNPDEGVSRNALMSYKTFTVVTRGQKTDIVLQVDLRNNQFMLRRGSKSFKCLLTEMDRIRAYITDEVAEALGYGKVGEGAARLLDSVSAVIRAKDDLIRLQDSKITVQEGADK